jgi:hypothetical protein
VRGAKLLRTCHIRPMTTYQIIPVGDGRGFNIGVAGSDGTRQTMLGFDTMEEVEAWIDQDRRLTGAADLQFSDRIAAQSP